ncbi:hypothetical protein [Oscillatoria sp. HE19RPO]|uniref:hypothetical protein n=1 Tax=Oscillatoria sp. HE19RPO TaxID=2954806 RepID=UPI0020C2B00B|nr:hypothetical protein [Oscillatoria sp. HE19RPO]
MKYSEASEGLQWRSPQGQTTGFEESPFTVLNGGSGYKSSPSGESLIGIISENLLRPSFLSSKNRIAYLYDNII